MLLYMDTLPLRVLAIDELENLRHARQALKDGGLFYTYADLVLQKEIDRLERSLSA